MSCADRLTCRFCLVVSICVLGRSAEAGEAPRYEIAYATYLGGSGDDMIRGVALGPGGELYLMGHTASPDFPVTRRAAQAKFGGGSGDAFVVKLAPSES